MRRGITVHLCILLVGQELSYLIIDLQICDCIGTGALSYRILIDIFNLGYSVQITGKAAEGSGSRTGMIQLTV